jgi:hypothetical protein
VNEHIRQVPVDMVLVVADMPRVFVDMVPDFHTVAAEATGMRGSGMAEVVRVCYNQIHIEVATAVVVHTVVVHTVVASCMETGLVVQRK